jgi:hypothetical protein
LAYGYIPYILVCIFSEAEELDVGVDSEEWQYVALSWLANFLSFHIITMKAKSDHMHQYKRTIILLSVKFKSGISNYVNQYWLKSGPGSMTKTRFPVPVPKIISP